jgi:hypothetical protein
MVLLQEVSRILTRRGGDAETRGIIELDFVGVRELSNIPSFKELRVWQNSMDLAMEIFELTRQFPVEERFSLTEY